MKTISNYVASFSFSKQIYAKRRLISFLYISLTTFPTRPLQVAHKVNQKLSNTNTDIRRGWWQLLYIDIALTWWLTSVAEIVFGLTQWLNFNSVLVHWHFWSNFFTIRRLVWLKFSTFITISINNYPRRQLLDEERRR